MVQAQPGANPQDPHPHRRTGEKKTLRTVARHASGWHALFPGRPADLDPKIAALERWCDEFGRDPGDIEWGLGLEPDDLERALRDDADTYLEMGFTQFTLGTTGPNWSLDGLGDWLAWRDDHNAARG